MIKISKVMDSIRVEKALCFLHQKDPYTKTTNILILRKTRNGLWGITGGGIDNGESSKVAIAREIQEELHINHKNIKDIKHIVDKVVSYNYGGNTRKVALYKAFYTTPLLPVNISIIDDPKYTQPEHYEFRWVSSYTDIKHLPFGSDDIKAMLKNLLS
jgi:8-oxo-dGTP pyrophosphatase MutT (NUDIX family)